MQRISGRTQALLLLLSAAAPLGGCAATAGGSPATARGGAISSAVGPDTLAVGRDANGEPCTADRTWRDAALADPFDAAWTLSCRSAAAARSVGTVRLIRNRDQAVSFEQSLACGTSQPANLPGLGNGTARLCRDAALGATVIVMSADVGKGRVVGSAIPSVAGPLALAMARLTVSTGAGDMVPGPAPAPVQIASLAPPPGGSDEAPPGSTQSDLGPALARGISLNHKGLHPEASRLLNDAVSRAGTGAPPAMAAELALEAALADSNIGFEDSAARHFANADRLFADNIIVRTPFLTRKRDAYAALDLMNQGNYQGALDALDRLSSAGRSEAAPLQDPRLLGLLNSPQADSGASSAVGGGDGALLAGLALEATVNWARSVTWLGLGDIDAADKSIRNARRDYNSLLARRVERGALRWLGARIDRQAARLAVRRGDFGTALALFDSAVDGLRLGALGTAGTGNEPVVAETMLERADALARSGAGRDAVKAAYESAVDAVLSSAGAIAPGFGIDRYLDLLIADITAGDGLTGLSGDAATRYFRALQSIGAPAVARQLGQLQAQVAADPALGVKIRDRADLERDITRLRYAIAAAQQTPDAAAPQTPPVDSGALEAERAAADARLIAIDAELAADPKYSRVDDRPATIDMLRMALADGEGYWALDEVAGRMFALYVVRDRVRAWSVEAPVALLKDFGTRIRGSIDGRLGEGKLVPFDVAASFALFKLLAGAGEADILSARALVVDPGGPLTNLPPTLLVTDRASVDARRGLAGAMEFDYSSTAFLGRLMPIGTAVSPRSFLVSRGLPSSRANQDFLGFAEHQVATTAGGSVNVGPSCSVPMADITALSNSLKPIARREVDLAAIAIGTPLAPIMTGNDFTDARISARTDLADFKILHFATHGLTEGSWGCPQSPPALVTTLVDGSDGLLSFDEIARLRLDANLVVLSACDTSAGVKSEALARQSGQEEAGAQLEGLVRAFLTANARSVMATFWPVSAEDDADLFVERFYRTARTETIGASLQTAQLALMSRPQTSHPFYWAPYFVVGDPMKRVLDRAPAAQAALSAPANP